MQVHPRKIKRIFVVTLVSPSPLLSFSIHPPPPDLSSAWGVFGKHEVKIIWLLNGTWDELLTRYHDE